MSWHSGDWANFAVSIGSLIAAGASFLAAKKANETAKVANLTADKSLKIEEVVAREEKRRWLTDLAISKANECNELLDSDGAIPSDHAIVSSIYTTLLNTMNYLKKASPNDYPKHYEAIWHFLHTSIIIEIITGKTSFDLYSSHPHASTIKMQHLDLRAKFKDSSLLTSPEETNWNPSIE